MAKKNLTEKVSDIYVNFFDLIRRERYEEAKELEQQHKKELACSSRTKKEEEYFGKLPMKVKENYLVYIMCY